jgi:hypothetical protein
VRTRPDLRVRWSKRERALLYGYEGDKHTSMVLAEFFEHLTMGTLYDYKGRKPEPGDDRTLAQELDARGYDLTTLRFSIRRKADADR